MRYLPEVEALRSFDMVAQELNFRRAAERLGIDHSALSRRIRDLEHRLRFALFERSTREVRLTEAGKVFLAENASLLRALQRSVENARMVADGRSGVIRVGYMSFAAADLLPSLIARFHSRRPDVRFKLTYLRSHAQKESLSRGEIDVGLMIGPWRNDMFDTVELARDPLCVFYLEGGAHAPKGRIGMKALAGAPLIMGSLEQWDLYRWMLDDMFLRKGIVPRVTLEASSITGILGLVAAGLGVSLFPACIARLCPPSVGHTPLKDRDLFIETIGVAARRRSALVEEFVAMLARPAAASA